MSAIVVLGGTSLAITVCIHLLIRSYPVAVLCSMIVIPAMWMLIAVYVRDGETIAATPFRNIIASSFVIAMVVGFPFWETRRAKRPPP